jgi:DNA-binding transcriptional ArsR family regulator
VRYYGRMTPRSPEPNIAEVAALIGDPGRAAMLLALLDGRDLAASELASVAGMTPQAATAHFKKLVAAGLLVGRSAGRHHFFRIASPEVGHAIETLATIAPPAKIVALGQSTTLERLRAARSCYDHLAGRLGVVVTDRLVERKAIEPAGRDFMLASRGREVFGELGVDLDDIQAERRSFARACIDWTERRPHLAGSLGASVLAVFIRKRWVTRNSTDRALRVTPDGARELRRRYNITC